MAFRDIIRGFRTAPEGRLRITDSVAETYAAVDPLELHVEVAAGSSVRLVVLHTRPMADAQLTLTLGEGAQAECIEIFTAGTGSSLGVRQQTRSVSRLTVVMLAGAAASCTVDLEAPDADAEVGGVFLLTGCERGSMTLETNHRVADCRSASYIKGVAGGEAVGLFDGKVYVAPDAQRTDARQQSRNVLLSETARIVTRPQLEIYADDVKCTHGATVGQMDDEAVLYMRQRGLSETQARRLQIEGFIGEVIRRCGIEPLCEKLMKLATAKMEGL